MTLHYLTESKIFLQKIKIKLLYWLLKRSKNPPAWVQFLEKANSIKKTKRYQDHPFYLRGLIWLRFIPYAYLRGVYWYLSQLLHYHDPEVWEILDSDTIEKPVLRDCIGESIGEVQARKMHWVYWGEECMRMSKRKK